jgi:DNA polymerase III delta prime subunit
MKTVIFPSTLFISSDSKQINTHINHLCQQLKNNINPNNPDIFIINQDTGWTIDLTRQIKNFLAQKPFNHPNKIVIIHQADNFNIESQNALLKTIEDPGPNNYIIITTTKPSKLLPTIISRCHSIKLRNLNQTTPNLTPLTISYQLKKDLALSDSLSKDKNNVLPYLKQQLKLYQNILVKNPSQNNSHLIQKLITAINMIDNNVDPKSALDYFFLT